MSNELENITMALRTVFVSAIIKKAAIRRTYQGGEASFRADYPQASEDQQLFALASVSTCEMAKIVEALTTTGLKLGSCFALASPWGIDTCPDIRIEQVTGGMFPIWEARALVDEPEVMAAEGEKIVRVLMQAGWNFYLPETPSTTEHPSF
ncbi:MAG: hypothetical protein J0L71_19545 [Candidatus Accumulibacter sp.]|uniref:hypothetical protein n=1 Tax=Accumulibacter sp. TaxID=2053492 RepID=UPI001AC151C3|nr:hypothetical protein [Accumulibacter sp.]MBN8519996.1 hypothetical protein [Accumulibacter sp.]